jgi:predicted dehydrogenase
VLAGRPSSSPGYATFADGHDEMLVGEAIARSAREGRWVDVERPAGSAATRQTVTTGSVR